MSLFKYSGISSLACASALGLAALPGCGAKVDTFFSMGADVGGASTTGGRVNVGPTGGAAAATSGGAAAAAGSTSSGNLAGGTFAGVGTLLATGGETSVASGGTSSTAVATGPHAGGTSSAVSSGTSDTTGGMKTGTAGGTSASSFGGSSATTGGAGIAGTNTSSGAPATGGSSALPVSTGGLQATGGSRATGGSSALPVSTGGMQATGGRSSLPVSTGGTPGDAVWPCPGLPAAIDSNQFYEALGAGNDTPVETNLILIERSRIMNNVIDGTLMTRWQVIEQAIKGYLADVMSSTQPFAMTYFGYSADSTDPAECDPASYTTTVVPVFTNPGAQTDVTSVASSLQNMENSLGGQTPTYPALKGALEFAVRQGYARVILVTGGYPDSCNPAGYAADDLSPSIDAANSAFQNYGVQTSVIGLGVIPQTRLDQIAIAGGTAGVAVVNGPNPVGQMTVALIQAAYPSYGLPASSMNNCQVPFEASWDPPMSMSGARLTRDFYFADGVQEIPFVQSAADCTGPNGGFYFDRMVNPTQIAYCPCTCAYAVWYATMNETLYLPCEGYSCN